MNCEKGCRDAPLFIYYQSFRPFSRNHGNDLMTKCRQKLQKKETRRYSQAYSRSPNLYTT